MSLEGYVKPVSSVSPRTSAAEIGRVMAANDVGAVVVVSDDGKPMGLVTDRDVCLRVVAQGKDPNHVNAEQIMSTGVATVGPEDSLVRVTEVMRDCNVRRIPIVDQQGRAIGLVSLDDVVVLLGAELNNVASAIWKGIAREASATTSG